MKRWEWIQEILYQAFFCAFGAKLNRKILPKLSDFTKTHWKMTETQVKTAKNSIFGCFCTKKVKIACKKILMFLWPLRVAKFGHLIKFKITMTGRNCWNIQLKNVETQLKIDKTQSKSEKTQQNFCKTQYSDALDH